MTLRLATRFAPRALAAAFRRDERGVSAIEFALILPLMVLIYLASVDITLVITADRRVTNIASSVGDLVSQVTQIDDPEMADIFTAASEIIQPMPADTLSIAVTSVVADADGNTTIAWSEALNGGAGTPGDSFTLPEGIIEPLGSVIVSTVSYTYTSPVAQFLTGASIDLDEVFYLRPRRTNQIAYVD